MKSAWDEREREREKRWLAFGKYIFDMHFQCAPLTLIHCLSIVKCHLSISIWCFFCLASATRNEWGWEKKMFQCEYRMTFMKCAHGATVIGVEKKCSSTNRLSLFNVFFFSFDDEFFKIHLFYISFSISALIWTRRVQIQTSVQCAHKYKCLMLLKAIPHRERERRFHFFSLGFWIPFNPLNVVCARVDSGFCRAFLCFVHFIECILVLGDFSVVFWL